MGEIEAIFKNYGKWSSVEEYDYQVKLVQENDGVQVNSKEENGYIDIEYVNRIGKYKARMLIQLFDKHKKFYQYFLKNFRKVIIQNNRKREQSDEIVINNEPCSIYLEELLDQLLSSYPRNYFHCILTKIKSQKNLLTDEDALDLIRCQILTEDVNAKKIDFFKYLDLMQGKFIDKDFYYERVLIDLVFQYHNYSILEQYMNHQNQEEIRKEIFRALHGIYGLALLNQSLEHQKRLFEKSHNTFLKNNLGSLNVLFNKQVYQIISQLISRYQQSNNKESILTSREVTLNLAYEFLDEIDSTGVLRQEIKENIENGSIMLWDPNDTEIRQKMQETYGKMFCIDEPLCCSSYDEDGNLISQGINIPLQFTLEDVFVLVHEFIHFHSNYMNPQRIKNGLLKETFSIYFENLVLEFLKRKGYAEKNLPVNFRALDAFYNFVDISPSIIYFSQYMKEGKIDLDYLYRNIRIVEEGVAKVYDQLGRSLEERKAELEKVGIYDSIEMSANQLIYNINHILLCNDESIYRGSPYLFGTILSKFAMENDVPFSVMLQFSNDLNVIEDPFVVMKRVGIDLERYGFKSNVSAKEEKISDVQVTGLRIR